MRRTNGRRRVALIFVAFALGWTFVPVAGAHTHDAPAPAPPAALPRAAEVDAPQAGHAADPHPLVGAARPVHDAAEWPWAAGAILVASGAGLFATRRFSVRLGVGALLIASGAIHLLLAPAHWQEGWHLGAFFVVSSFVLFGLAMSVTRTRRQPPWLGPGVLTILIGLYFVSRTVVLPGVGHTESYDVAGLLTKSAEALALIGYVVLLRRSPTRTRLSELELTARR